MSSRDPQVGERFRVQSNWGLPKDAPNPTYTVVRRDRFDVLGDTLWVHFDDDADPETVCEWYTADIRGDESLG